MKAPDLRKVSPENYPRFAGIHCYASDYTFIVAKYCQRPGHVQECICQPVRMPAHLWAEFCSYDPFVPHPEPSKLSPGEWASLAELDDRKVTSPKYLPKSKKKAGAANLPREQARTFIQCAMKTCRKPRVVYRQLAFTGAEEQQWLAETDGCSSYVEATRSLPRAH